MIMRHNSVRIKAPKGQMVVSREMRCVGYLVQCPEQDAHLYELMDEEEARALRRSGKRKTKNELARKKRNTAKSANARKTL